MSKITAAFERPDHTSTPRKGKIMIDLTQDGSPASNAQNNRISAQVRSGGITKVNNTMPAQMKAVGDQMLSDDANGAEFKLSPVHASIVSIDRPTTPRSSRHVTFSPILEDELPSVTLYSRRHPDKSSKNSNQVLPRKG